MTTDPTLAIELLDAIKAATEAEKALRDAYGHDDHHRQLAVRQEAKASLERLLRNDCNIEPELVWRVLL